MYFLGLLVRLFACLFRIADVKMQNHMDDFEWLLEAAEGAIARFDAEGFLVQHSIALTECWTLVTCLTQRPHYEQLIAELAKAGYGSPTQCQHLASQCASLTQEQRRLQKQLTVSANATLSAPPHPTQTIYLRRTSTGDMVWVIKMEKLEPPTQHLDGSAVGQTPNPEIQKYLHHSQQFLQAILEAIPDPLFVKNEQHQLVLLNQAFVQIFGAKINGSLLGKTDHDLMPKEQADICQRQDRLAFHHNHPIHNDEEVQGSYGQSRLYYLTKKAFGDSYGQKFLVGIARDVTRQRQAEKALQTSEANNRALLLAIPDMLMRIRRDGRLEYIKLSAFVTPYLPPEQTASQEGGQTIYNMLPPEQAERRMNAVRQALDSGCVQIYEQILEVEGRMVYEEVRVSPCGEEEVLVMIRDISDRKRAEAEVQRSLVKTQQLNYLKTRFLEMVSHEFRTPLTQIQAATDLLRYLPTNEAEREEYFENIQQGIVQMTRMMNEIVHLQQTMEDSIAMNLQPVNLERLCQDAIADLTHKNNRQISLTVHNPECCQSVCTDAHALQQILCHMLNNALQYSEPITEITLYLEVKRNQFLLSITDHGIGIPKEDRPHLFEYFYRGRNIGTLPGTGLGLAIAKHYINLLQGSVEVIDPPHSGTCFALSFPLSLPDPDCSFG